MTRPKMCRSVTHWTITKTFLRLCLAILATKSVLDYLAFEVLSNQQLLSRSQLFPAVTICNVASNVQKKFEDIPKLDDVDIPMNEVVYYMLGSNGFKLMANTKNTKRETKELKVANPTRFMSYGHSKILLARIGDSCTKTCLNNGLVCQDVFPYMTRTEWLQLIAPLAATQNGVQNETFELLSNSNLTNCTHAISKDNLVRCHDSSTCLTPVSDKEAKVCACEEGKSEFTMTKHSADDTCFAACGRLQKKCRFDKIFGLTSKEIQLTIKQLLNISAEMSPKLQTTNVNSSTVEVCPFAIKKYSMMCTDIGSFSPKCNSSKTVDLGPIKKSSLCECSRYIQYYNRSNSSCDCLNDAECIEIEQQKFCYCSKGFYGDKCQYAEDACIGHRCAAGSTCFNRHSTYSCFCPPGIAGSNCNDTFCSINVCPASKICMTFVDAYGCSSSENLDKFDKIFRDWFDMSSNVIYLLIGASENSGRLSLRIFPLLTISYAKNFVQVLTPYVKHVDGRAFAAVLGFYLNRNIYSCMFNQEPCQSWTENFHSQYSMCYSFNNNKTQQLRLSQRAGPKFGLNVVLDFNLKQDFAKMSGLVYKVVFHEPEGAVDPDNEGHSILQGHVTSFYLSRVSQKSLASPYGLCIQSKDSIEPYYYEEDYTIDNCVKSYAQMITMQNCSCVSPRFYYPEDTELESCAVNLNSNCSNYIEQTITEVEHCKPACKNSFIRADLALSQQLKKCSSAESEICQNSKNRFAKFSVHFGTLQSSSFEEYPKLTIPVALAGFGGYSGLFLGYSFITFAEIAFDLAKKALNCFKKFKNIQ